MTTTNPAVRFLVSSLVAAGLVALTGLAQAQCCDGYTAATACDGVALTKSRWCIEDTVPTGQAALPSEFCAYGDVVVSTLESVFNIQAKDVVEFELDSQTGGAHTGTSCGRLGVGVAYDAFKGSAYGAPGFWGYLLSLHEAINDWTGMSTPGWPTDFWADHDCSPAASRARFARDGARVSVGDPNHRVISSASRSSRRS